MGAALLQHRLGADSEVTVSSAGIGALVGYPAAEHAVELMAEHGIDISGHRARQLNADIIDSTDLILVMESRHKRVIDTNEPTALGKVYRIGEWHDFDIRDPFQQPKSAFAEVLALISQGVDDWIERIKALPGQIRPG